MTTEKEPVITYKASTKTKAPEDVELKLTEFIDIKGWKANGNKLDRRTVKDIVLQPTPEKEEFQSGDTVEWNGDEAKGDGQASLFS